jgi:hypothetical protein
MLPFVVVVLTAAAAVGLLLFVGQLLLLKAAAAASSFDVRMAAPIGCWDIILFLYKRSYALTKNVSVDFLQLKLARVS